MWRALNYDAWVNVPILLMHILVVSKNKSMALTGVLVGVVVGVVDGTFVGV